MENLRTNRYYVFVHPSFPKEEKICFLDRMLNYFGDINDKKTVMVKFYINGICHLDTIPTSCIVSHYNPYDEIALNLLKLLNK